jgi:hypothetical protein
VRFRIVLLLAAALPLFAVWWGLPADPPPRPEVEPAVSTPALSPEVPPGVTVVSGFVFDAADGRPVEGAVLRGRSEGGATVTGRTDARGRYVLSLPESDRRVTDLHLRAAGYFEEEGWSTEVTAAGRTRTFFLERIRRAIPGRAADHRGRPVAGATVLIEDEEPRISDAEGRFGPVRVGRPGISFCAWTDHHAFTAGEWYAIDGTWPDELVVRLDPTAPTRVLVLDGEGRPVKGAVVRRESDGYPQRLETGAGGTVIFPLWPYEEELLVASEGDRLGGTTVRGGGSARIVIRSRDDPLFRPPREPSSASPPPELPGSPVEDARVSCPPAPPENPPVLRLVEFQVTTPDGRPLPGAELTVHCRLPAPGMNFLNWSGGEFADEAGRCSIEVPVGENLRVSAEWGDLFAGHRELTLPARGDLIPLILTLAARTPPDYGAESGPDPVPNPVFVRVLDDAGLPVPDAEVTGLSVGYERTDREGLAVIPAEDPDAAFRFYVSVPGNPDLWATGLPGGPPAVVRLPPRGSIRIRLSEGYLDSREDPEFEIFASELQRQTFLSPKVRGFVTDEGSSIRIDCPAGTWPLVFGMWPGESVLYPRVTVRSGEETILSYDFPESPPVELRTLGPMGEPVKGALICVAETLAGDLESGTGGETDASEGYWFGAIPAGTGHLLVRADGYAPAVHGPLDLWAPLRIDLRLGVGAKVRGRLLCPSGEPIDGTVGWQPAGGPLFAETDRIDQNGSFTLPSLLPQGRQTLVALVEGRAPVKQVVEVPGSGEVEVTIVVR